jgi:glycosyltransferase involved in cell wall biosynthesis
MKHILWLVSWYPDEISPYNGDFIQRHALAVARHAKLTVVYVAQHGPGVELPHSKELVTASDELEEIRVYFEYKKTGLAMLDKLRYNRKYFKAYKKFMRRLYLREFGKPDIVHVHIPMKAGRMALWLKHRLQVPYLVTEHSSAYSGEVPDAYERRGKYYRTWVKRIFENAAAATTVSEKLGGRLKQLFNIREMRIIPNVADTNYFNYAPKQPPRFRFLHASTMDHPKNVEGILSVLHQLKNTRTDWECVMLGWDTPALRNLCTELGLDDHVQWKGVVPYREVALEMQHASALLMFSRYENQPCVILEALCCALPVIATSVGGIPELVNGANGVLVEPGNEAQLLRACLGCMEGYALFDRAAIAAEAQRRFSYDAVGKQFVELYENYAGKLSS